MKIRKFGSMLGEENSVANAQLHRISMKLPPFWDKHPKLWFASVESQFIMSGITQDSTKFYSVVSILSSEVLNYVSDIVLQPPENNKYDKLKERLIADFSDSEQTRIKAVLSELMLGDDKPSHLLRKMKQLAGLTLNEEFLKTLWLQRLPTQHQAILSVSEDSLDKLALMADKIHETAGNSISEIKCSKPSVTELEELRIQISELTKKMELFGRNRNRSVSNNRSVNGRARSKSPSKKKVYDNCWYHYKFGENAKRCQPPCKFKNQEN